MSVPTVDAWTTPTGLVDETEFTPWAEEGWLSWNGQSPEMAVCGFAMTLVQMMRPKLICETGVGQGFMTRSIVPLLSPPQLLIAHESDDGWREAIWRLPFWKENRFTAWLSEDPTPNVLSEPDLCIFDSDWSLRFEEICLWHEHAKPGAVAIIHDTAEREGTIHQAMRDLIGELGITGFFLRNPRGCFVATKGGNDGRQTQDTGEEDNA